jgi:hypothetical protein
MSMPVRGWCLFIGSAIGCVIQIAQELARSPDVPADATWGSLAISSAVAACLVLAYEHDACPPPRLGKLPPLPRSCGMGTPRHPPVPHPPALLARSARGGLHRART